MNKTKVFRQSDNKIFADPCLVAENFWERFKGLMGKDHLAQGSGFLIPRCNSIHTFFMKFSIDVVYLDPDGKVLAVKQGMKPWRVDLPVWEADFVLELASGGAHGISKGERLCLS